MTLTAWFIFFLIIQVVHFLGTWKLYVNAGKKAWEAAIPVYNAIVLMDIIKRPKWWTILLFIPIINLLMYPVVWIETARSFGKNTTLDGFLAVLTLGFYNYYISYATKATYIEDRDLQSKTAAGEWASSIVFAIIAATLVHTYVMQPYTIPTSSLEKSLLVGDFLFVSKFHYGARTPMTTIAAPMVHDSLPFIKTKSYLQKPQLPYFRIPGFQDIKRNEIVVFSWPVDTVRFFRDDSGIHAHKPVDKKSNYVKRCVGVPGDSLQVIDGYVYINGTRTKLPYRAKPQYFHTVVATSDFNPYSLTSRYESTELGRMQNGDFTVNLTDANAVKLRKNPLIKSVTKNLSLAGTYDKRVFPHSPQYTWSTDNFGPIYIPEEGKTVALNPASIPFYKRIIEEYEGNNFLIDGDTYYVNGKAVTEYTFKQDYYWMMGDNRQNSEDARAWGYVPYDHIVGKPVFIWFSWDSNGKGLANKVRWDRVFTTVHGDGKPYSYIYVFLGILGLYFIGSTIIKRRKEEN